MFNRSKKLIRLLTALPNTPGIYLFYSFKKKLIYIGKASSLKNRVRSYFQGIKSPRPIEEMIHEVADIKWEQTESALEAIILEALYIKKFQPKYNVLGKDDKSWNYIIVSKDEYPRVETMREREYEQSRQSKQSRQNRYVFGPYPGLNMPATMKLLRKMFRFSTCQKIKKSIPIASGQNNKRPCLYYQMGRCLGVCVGEISPADYNRKVIRPLVMFLRGQKKSVVKLFVREMKLASKSENYEEAARLRDQLKNLRRIQDIALLNRSFVNEGNAGIREIATSAARHPCNDMRIEGYDISNLGPTEKVASMVVFKAGESDKSQYRKFIIKTVLGQSDVDCLKEVIRRRFNHSEWPRPDVILVDGGRAQVNQVCKVLNVCNVHKAREIPVVGIAKGPERKRNDFILGDKSADFINWVYKNRALLIRVRDEAHRFAILFHRARRGKFMSYNGLLTKNRK